MLAEMITMILNPMLIREETKLFNEGSTFERVSILLIPRVIAPTSHKPIINTANAPAIFGVNAATCSIILFKYSCMILSF